MPSEDCCGSRRGLQEIVLDPFTSIKTSCTLSVVFLSEKFGPRVLLVHNSLILDFFANDKRGAMTARKRTSIRSSI